MQSGTNNPVILNNSTLHLSTSIVAIRSLLASVPRIFWENKVNTIAADVPVPCAARLSADKYVLVFHEDELQLLVQSKCEQLIEYANIFSWQKSIQYKKG